MCGAGGGGGSGHHLSGWVMSSEKLSYCSRWDVPLRTQADTGVAQGGETTHKAVRVARVSWLAGRPLLT